MVNSSGANGHHNGTRPPDEVLRAALHRYAEKSLPLNQRLDYLLKDFGYKISYTTLKKLNRDFNVNTVKKPPPEHISTTVIGEVISNNSSSRNGPSTVQNQISRQYKLKIPRDTVRRIMSDLDPGGAEARFPGRNRRPKERGHLTDTGVYYEIHFDGHEKLNFKGLVLAAIRVRLYHDTILTTSSVFVQATVDGGSETGELYAAHIALR
ncbi:hypothetical protein R3P38DRAFT_2668504 [Favolaschia claudopus]|uniref:Transposase n=1 Tax=Favolaschia claudopus TaxID=2862362 RepID=A0AAV9Z7S3_9AGAR